MQPLLCAIDCGVEEGGAANRIIVNVITIVLLYHMNCCQGYLNEAASMADNIPNKSNLLRPLLHWVGDNISTLRDRHLLNNLEKKALILIGNHKDTFSYLLTMPLSACLFVHIKNCYQ